MNRLVCVFLVVLLTLAVAASCTAAASQQRSRPGAFTRYEASTVSDLVSQIQNDPVVAQRYTSHFGVSKQELVDYFSQNLKLVAMKSPATVTTYFVSTSGRILSKQRQLTVGRRIFVGPGNKPVLEQGCGNPLTKRLPPPPEVKTEVKPIVETIGQPPTPEVVTPPVVEVAPVEEEKPEVIAALPAVEAVTIPPVATMSPAPSIFQFVGAVAPIVAGLQYLQADKPTPNVIPEPSSLVTVALGAFGVAAGFLKTRRRI